MMKKSEVSAETFGALIQSIHQTHQELAAHANKAINVGLTVRNWLIGFYIAEYEHRGKDRADYGAALLARLAEELQRLKIPCSDERELRRYRLFYTTYPQIRESLTPDFHKRIPRLSNFNGMRPKIVF